MGSLSQYIQDMQSKGYSKEQILAVLKKSNYPQSAIDIAFKAAHGDTTLPKSAKKANSLDSYIKTLLSQGYQVEQLKPYLQDQGYTTTQIDAAIANATGLQPNAKLPIGIAAIFLIIAIAVGFTLFMITKTADPTQTIPQQPPPTSLSLSLQLDTTTVLAGESLKAQVTIQNTAAQRNEKILFSLTNEEGTVFYSNEKTRPLTQELTTAELIDIPKDAKPGQYLLTVTIPTESITKTQTITVQGIERPTQNTISFSEPRPVLTIENTENKIDGAALAAKNGNTQSAQNTCQDIVNQASRDDCYEKLTLTTKNPTYCSDIISIESKDTCYMPFILEGSYQYCADLNSQDRKELCEQLKLLDSL